MNHVCEVPIPTYPDIDKINVYIRILPLINVFGTSRRYQHLYCMYVYYTSTFVLRPRRRVGKAAKDGTLVHRPS